MEQSEKRGPGRIAWIDSATTNLNVGRMKKAQKLDNNFIGEWLFPMREQRIGPIVDNELFSKTITGLDRLGQRNEERMVEALEVHPSHVA